MSEKGRREMRDPLNPDTKPAIFSPQHFPPSPSVIHNGSPLNDRTAGKAALLTLKELRIGAGESHRRSRVAGCPCPVSPPGPPTGNSEGMYRPHSARAATRWDPFNGSFSCNFVKLQNIAPLSFTLEVAGASPAIDLMERLLNVTANVLNVGKSGVLVSAEP